MTRINFPITTTISNEIKIFCQEKNISIAELIRVGYGMMKYQKKFDDANFSIAQKHTIFVVLCREIDDIKNDIKDTKDGVDAFRELLRKTLEV